MTVTEEGILLRNGFACFGVMFCLILAMSTNPRFSFIPFLGAVGVLVEGIYIGMNVAMLMAFEFQKEEEVKNHRISIAALTPEEEH